MDEKRTVYNAAKEGKLQRIKVFLDHRPRSEVSRLVHSKHEGATPLIASCRHGHLPVVEYLLEKCCADVEQVGSVSFDGETIDGAPPLWCASAAGHLNIVKFLIKKGAGVNNTTFTNSTPLRAACFDGHFDIVRYLCEHGADIEIANRHGHTCLMISCYKGHLKIVKYLIEKGGDVNRKSLKGNTALHDCAESGSLDIMKILLEHKAQMTKDSYDMTPLLAASVTGHALIVEYLISRPECSKSERINALELLGATYVDKKRDMLGALDYWKRAMKERYHDDNDLIEKPTDMSPIAAYENAVEARTMNELADVISEPDNMRMQALLVRERILGPAHPDTSYYIRYRGAVYADMGNFERCIDLWMYALDMQQKILEPLNPMTQSSFLSFAELFLFMMTESRRRKPHPVNFQDMMVVFGKAVRELELGMTQLAKTPSMERETSHFNRLLVIIMHLVALVCRNMSKCTKDEDMAFKRVAYRLVRMNPRGDKGYTPLHMACSEDTSTVGKFPMCSFPSLPVVELLIEVGASVTAVDLKCNSPLHIAAANKKCPADVIRLLLNKGSHIDAVNIDHRNPMQLLQDTSIYDIVTPLNYMTLQCLAARKVEECGIPYKGQVPKKLESFLRMH